MNKFHEMMKKKRDLSPAEKHAKMKVLGDMKHELANHAGDKLDGLKKVSVMSNSPEGLQSGLNKAQSMMPQDPSPMQASMPMMSEGGEVNSPAEDIMNEIDNETSTHESEPGKMLDDNMEESMGHIGADVDMTHEHDEDLDLEEIKSRIMHLMELQKKAESKK